jgi:hypothetical protein
VGVTRGQPSWLATPVTAVRKAISNDAGYEHMLGVSTQDGVDHTHAEVLESIASDDRWMIMAQAS